MRQIVHLSAGGVGLRLRFSNIFGTTPLLLRSIHVAIRKSGDEIDPQTDHAVSFAGLKEVTVAPGTSVLSDAINLSVGAQKDVAVSFFVPEKITAPAIHYVTLQTSYFVAGDHTADPSLEKARSEEHTSELQSP